MIRRCLLLKFVMVSWVFGQDPTIQEDIDSLVQSSKRLTKVWPWQQELPEAQRVAKHGIHAAPLLIRFLQFDSSDSWGDQDFNICVEQQVELALCRIAGMDAEPGKTVFSIRSSDQSNASVTRFWRDWVSKRRSGTRE